MTVEKPSHAQQVELAAYNKALINFNDAWLNLKHQINPNIRKKPSRLIDKVIENKDGDRTQSRYRIMTLKNENGSITFKATKQKINHLVNRHVTPNRSFWGKSTQTYLIIWNNGLVHSIKSGNHFNDLSDNAIVPFLNPEKPFKPRSRLIGR